MINVSPSPVTGSELEWDRLRSYLRAETAPLALIEIESQAQAEEIVAAVRHECGPGTVEVYRLSEDDISGESSRSVLESLVASRSYRGVSLVLVLVLGLAKSTSDEEKARRFWTWMNSQRELWRPPEGKLAFVLTPRQVDDLCRFAGALWDWIPLKFSLLQMDRSEHLGQEDHHSLLLDRDRRQPGDVARLLPALRQQLLTARQQGLPESMIRRDYAWPLFRALTDSRRLREAAAILHTDLAGDFDTELDLDEQCKWWFVVGRFFLERWELDDAEWAYQNLVFAAQSSGDEQMTTEGYNGLGRIAAERRDFDAAEQWYLRSLEVSEKLDDEFNAAFIYQELGILAHKRHDLDIAERWYRKSLDIRESSGSEAVANIYHNLGFLAQDRRQLDAAEQWYLKAVKIKEELGDEHGTAITYHHLGWVAAERRDFDSAEQWYQKALEISRKLGDEHAAASTYHQLGMLATDRGDFEAAEKWYREALKILERLGDEHTAANTYGQFGILAAVRKRYEDAGRWLIKSVFAFRRKGDDAGAERNKENFVIAHQHATRAEQMKLRAMWEKADLGTFPDVSHVRQG